MAIRIREVKGLLVALCAAETVPKLDDLYLNDNIHQALAVKFAEDWQGQLVDWKWHTEWGVMKNEQDKEQLKLRVVWDYENFITK